MQGNPEGDGRNSVWPSGTTVNRKLETIIFCANVASSPSCGPLTRKNDGQRRKRQVKGEKQQRRVEQSCHHEKTAAISMPNSQRAPIGMVHANGPSAE